MATLLKNINRSHRSLKKYPDILTVEQVQEILSVGHYSVYKLIHNNTLRHVKIGQGYRIVKQSLIEYLYGGELNELA